MYYKTEEPSHFLSDADVAIWLRVSPSWVRVQRYNRRHGLSHKFNIDPVMIGSMPRYRHEDVVAWINSLSPANDVGGGAS
jgi:hypothetical protein